MEMRIVGIRNFYVQQPLSLSLVRISAFSLVGNHPSPNSVWMLWVGLTSHVSRVTGACDPGLSSPTYPSLDHRKWFGDGLVSEFGPMRVSPLFL